MDSSIPDDYEILLELYLNLKKDFEGIKQKLHDSTRQLKVNDALIREYQGEIDILQNGETSQYLKYEAKISSLEETVANLRSNHLQNISVLEFDLLKKEKENEDLKNEIDIIKRKNLLEEKSNISVNFNELVELSNENEILKENYQELQEAFQNCREQHLEMEETLQEYKQQVFEFEESLKTKREELAEKSILIDKLNEDLFTLNRELDNYRNKPLQDSSKGNSLFAEVDDRRVQLQKTVNDMKSSYIDIKQEQRKHEKLISHLRKENADLRALWKKDLVQIQDDHSEIVDALNSRLRLLEELHEKHKKELQEQPTPCSDNLSEAFTFYEAMIESKSSEIKKLEIKLSDRSITEHMLSVSLAKAHKELRLLRLSKLELQQQIEENEEKELMAKEEAICRRYTMHDDVIEKPREPTLPLSPNVKGCLRPIENIKRERDNLESIYNDILTKDQGLDFPDKDKKSPTSIKTECSNDKDAKYPVNELAIEDQENRRVDDAPVASKTKGVKFSADTVSPVSNPARRRGTKIFVMKKMN